MSADSSILPARTVRAPRVEVRTATFGLEVTRAPTKDEEAIVAAILFRYSLRLEGRRKVRGVACGDIEGGRNLKQGDDDLTLFSFPDVGGEEVEERDRARASRTASRAKRSRDLTRDLGRTVRRIRACLCYDRVPRGCSG